MESSDKEDYEAKEKAFYSAMIAAWLTTRLERDKQLLGLSVTAIGLLVTLLRTVGVSSPLQIILFGLALFAFLITVVLVIYILGENSTHIEKILGGSEIESRKLMCLDNCPIGRSGFANIRIRVMNVELNGILKQSQVTVEEFIEHL